MLTMGAVRDLANTIRPRRARIAAKAQAREGTLYINVNTLV